MLGFAALFKNLSFQSGHDMIAKKLIPMKRWRRPGPSPPPYRELPAGARQSAREGQHLLSFRQEMAERLPPLQGNEAALRSAPAAKSGGTTSPFVLSW